MSLLWLRALLAAALFLAVSASARRPLGSDQVTPQTARRACTFSALGIQTVKIPSRISHALCPPYVGKSGCSPAAVLRRDNAAPSPPTTHSTQTHTWSLLSTRAQESVFGIMHTLLFCTGPWNPDIYLLAPTAAVRAFPVIATRSQVNRLLVVISPLRPYTARKAGFVGGSKGCCCISVLKWRIGHMRHAH